MARNMRPIRSIYVPCDLRFIWDRHGFALSIHTPLIGFGFYKNFSCMDRMGRGTRIWFGLISRIFTDDYGLIYFWNWTKEFSFTADWEDARI